jgi:hypothetical protein
MTQSILKLYVSILGITLLTKIKASILILSLTLISNMTLRIAMFSITALGISVTYRMLSVPV